MQAELSTRAGELAAEIADLLAARVPGLLGDFPVGRYLAFYRSAPPMAHYHFVPPRARAFCYAIETSAGRQGLEDYHRLALAWLIRDGVSDGSIRLTDEARELREDYLARVLVAIGKGRRGYFRPGNDMFAKDFAVCRGRLLPGGAELFDPHTGVPRSVLLKGGVGQFLSGLGLVQRLGGFRPVWALHFDRRLVKDFSEEGYRQLYLRAAALLELNPQVRGLASWSWWHDPEVARISPELGFIGRVPESAGARLLRVGEDESATASALHMSSRRTALHREGAYRPCVYMLAWPRRDLLAWAAGYRQVNSPAAK